MFRHIFDNAQDMASYPIFSLLVFFLFFVAMTIYLLKTKKAHLDEMSRLPLTDDSTEKPSNS